YVATGEPLDKAGSYALQGRGGELVEKVEGSRSNVIGLPLERVMPLLERVGVRPA
ncbi:MAG: Maf family protein, partial [Myxococcota bacterium]